MSRTLTDREENALAGLYDTAAEVLESPLHRLDPQLRRDLKAALDEMRAARMIALAAEAKETNA
jgi:hypothetical protein